MAITDTKRTQGRKRRCTELNQPKLKENIDRSVMMVTALSPIIGYDKPSVISY
jgi:fumarate hydratase class II